jgi:hypothetical protein
VRNSRIAQTLDLIGRQGHLVPPPEDEGIGRLRDAMMKMGADADEPLVVRQLDARKIHIRIRDDGSEHVPILNRHA